MSRVDQQTRERWFALLDADIDRIFAGQAPNNAGLTQLMAPISALRSMTEVTFNDELVQGMASQAALLVPPKEAEQQVRPSRVSLFFVRLRARAAASAATLLMVSGIAGVAAAADGAAPGDWNYGIDRALEAVGIGDGGAEERLLELRAMSDREDDGSNAAIAAGTEHAADQILANGSEQSAAVRAQVAAERCGATSGFFPPLGSLRMRFGWLCCLTWGCAEKVQIPLLTAPTRLRRAGCSLFRKLHGPLAVGL